MAGYDFIHSVMTNGIGGVNCGGRENDIVPGRGQEIALADSKAYQYLIRTADHAKEYTLTGYLRPCRMARGKLAGYTLTLKGREIFSNSKLVENWIIAEAERKEAEREERRLNKLNKST